MKQPIQRLVELLHHQKHQLAYRKRTKMVVEMVQQVESEGQFPNAGYAFDTGVLTLELTQVIEGSLKHWVSEIECSRLILWNGQWQRVDAVARQLRQEHSERFRPLQVKCRNGRNQDVLGVYQNSSLECYGRKRLVIIHQ